MIFMTHEELQRKLDTEEKETLVVYEMKFVDYVFDRLLESMTDEECEEAIKIMNTINNQGLVRMSGRLRTYVRHFRGEDITLSIDRLSHGEFCFLIAYIALRKRTYIAFNDLFGSLSRRSTVRFLDTFKDNEYLIICVSSEYSKRYYENLVNNIRNGVYPDYYKEV